MRWFRFTRGARDREAAIEESVLALRVADLLRDQPVPFPAEAHITRDALHTPRRGSRADSAASARASPTDPG